MFTLNDLLTELGIPTTSLDDQVQEMMTPIHIEFLDQRFTIDKIKYDPDGDIIIVVDA